MYFLYFSFCISLFLFSTSSCQLSRACVPRVKTSLSFSTTRRRCQLLASLTQQPYCQFSDRAILTITTIKRNNKQQNKQTTSTFKTKGTTRRRCQLLTSLTHSTCQTSSSLDNCNNNNNKQSMDDNNKTLATIANTISARQDNSNDSNNVNNNNNSYNATT